MYTQCPDCRAAFHVTPAVLQQAGGNVRCGGCGHAFNALERLSEEFPDGTDNGFSDERTKALLDSLDEITGTDNIRIEDTGVEWRVLDEDPESDQTENADSVRVDDSPGADASGRGESDDQEDTGDTGSLRWRIGDAAGDPQDQQIAGEATPPPAPAVEDSPARETNPQEALDLPVELQPGEERYDDNTPFPGALDDEADESALPDMPRRRAEDLLEPRSPELDERQVDLALSEPEDWTDLLDEVAAEPCGEEVSIDIAAAHDGPIRDIDAADDEAIPDIDITGTRDVDFPSDIDTQFDLQALEMGIGAGAEFDPTGEEPIMDADELTLVETDDELTLIEDEETVDSADTGDFRIAEDDGASIDSLELDDPADSRESTGEFERRIALAAEALAHDDDDDDANADADIEPAFETPAPEAAGTEHYVPPQTEEEMTINRLIDQDLLRLASEEHAFAATSGGTARNPQLDSPHVETIIMEGDFVRNSLEGELPAADTGIDIGPPADDAGPSLRDTYIRARNRLSGGRYIANPPRYGLIAGVGVLTLLLGAQLVHAYRESLATFGTFNHTVGSLYRLFGAPITPDWDANGWQFETTSGSTDAFGQVLTISSRIANRSSDALPYPLLHVSLTDRYEEIIGSRLLEPGQYLAGTNGRDDVAPGDNFTATVNIASPSPEATGFKLNVCYRMSIEQVRCATGAFKE